MTGGGDQSWEVFISYAGPDEATAEQLHQLLTERGKRVYFHPESVEPGDEWRADIPRHIQASAVTAALISQHSVAAQYQDEEITLALDLAKETAHRVVPIRLEQDVPFPFGLKRRQAIDAFGTDGLVKAADALAALFPDDGRRAIVSDRIPHVSRWFTGRDDLLDQLVGIWQEGGSRVLTQVQSINGMGGVGKSTLAAVLAERVRADADVVWWLRSDQETSLIDDVIELADRLGIAEMDDRRERAREAVRYLSESDLRWLLVFDNVDDERMLAPWVPRGGRGLSLVTTRDRSMTQLGPTIDVDVLPTEVAADFLADRVREHDATAAADRAGAEVVAELVQGLPLALEQAGAWVAASALNTWQKFVDRSHDAAKNPFPDGSEPVGYELTTWASIQVSIDAASERSPLAERLWHVLGWLAPNDIPIAWLTAIADGDYFGSDTDAVEEAVVALERFSLLSLDGETIEEVHRVVQAAARRAASIESGTAAVAVLRTACPGAGHGHETWAINRALRSHALVARDGGVGLPESAADLFTVLNGCAQTVQFGGDPLASVAMFESNRDLAERHLGDRHPDTLTSRANLAESYWSVGRHDDAIELNEQVLADRVVVLGDRHPDTLTSRANLASSYWSVGRHDDAIELNERVLADRVEVLGDRHPDTLTSRANLAESYWSVGRHDDAIELLRATITQAAQLDHEHPYLASWRNALSEWTST